MNLLVDSSIWIPFLRGHADLPARVANAMTVGTARICPMVWLEIFQGIRNKREQQIADELSEHCPSLPMDEMCWRNAALLGRSAQRSGINCPMADILIVACARRHSAEIEHNDKHIEALLTLDS